MFLGFVDSVRAASWLGKCTARRSGCIFLSCAHRYDVLFCFLTQLYSFLSSVPRIFGKIYVWNETPINWWVILYSLVLDAKTTIWESYVASPDTTGVQKARVPPSQRRYTKGKTEIRAVTFSNLTPNLDQQNSNRVICLAIVGAYNSWTAALLDTIYFSDLL